MMEVRSASDIAAHIAKETESLILAQLNEHISRGLIVIEQTQPQFVSHADNPNKVDIRMSVRFKLKEQEYVEKLEKNLKIAVETLEQSYRAMADCAARVKAPDTYMFTDIKEALEKIRGKA